MQPKMPAGLEKIKHVVVLMFENRSFDHIFGDFPNVDGLFVNGALKPECYNTANPLIPPDPVTNPQYWPVPVDPYQPLPGDFNHDFGDGMMPDLFGPIFGVVPESSVNDPADSNATYVSGYVAGSPFGVAMKPPPATYPAHNSGFHSTYQNCEPQGARALSYFKKGDLKALHALAENFVICDNWYCDMPGHTEPNRCFMHCSTTGTVGIDDPDGGTDESVTIFDRLNSAALSWKMYVPAIVTPSGITLKGHVDTAFLNANISGSSYTGVPLPQFALDCQNGLLPVYSFIMCWTPGTGPWTDTSMHPQSIIQPGENLLAAVYNTLRNSPRWEDTLLVVNFDENGGIYDHKFPPNTWPPDQEPRVVTQNVRGCCLNCWQLASRFDFSLLGLRIPALLISPWLRPGVDSTQYQNTSVVRFLIDLIQRLAPYCVPEGQDLYLTNRDRNATSIEEVFSKFGLGTMRDECPKNIESTANIVTPQGISCELPFGDGTLATPVVLSNPVLESEPVLYISELLTMYLRNLPGHPDSGKKVDRKFRNNTEVLAYVEERRKAASLFRQ